MCVESNVMFGYTYAGVIDSGHISLLQEQRCFVVDMFSDASLGPCCFFIGHPSLCLQSFALRIYL